MFVREGCSMGEMVSILLALLEFDVSPVFLRRYEDGVGVGEMLAEDKRDL